MFKKTFVFLSYVILISGLIGSITHIMHLQEKIETLTKQNKSLRRDSREWKDNYISLQAEMSKRDYEGLEKSRKLEELILTKDELFNEIKNTLEPAFENVMNYEKISRKTVDDLKVNIISQMSIIVGAEQERYNELRKKLNGKVLNVTRENTELETNLKNMSAELEKIIRNRLEMQTDMKKEIDSTEDKSMSLNLKIAKLETKLRQRKATIKQLKANVKKMDNEMYRMRAENKDISIRISKYNTLQQRTYSYAEELGDYFLKAIKKNHLIRNAGRTVKDIVTLNWFKNLDYNKEAEKIKKELTALEEEGFQLRIHADTATD